MLPAKLDKEVADLKATYPVEVIEDSDVINVIIPGFATGDSYNTPTTTILLNAAELEFHNATIRSGS